MELYPLPNIRGTDCISSKKNEIKTLPLVILHRN